MKRFMLGMAAVMLACAAWNQAPAEATSTKACVTGEAIPTLGPGAVSR